MEEYPILKNEVNEWLRQIELVLAFCSARPEDGGRGAVYALLQANKR
jgi:DNA-nicking Smr family endonuclease